MSKFCHPSARARRTWHTSDIRGGGPDARHPAGAVLAALRDPSPNWSPEARARVTLIDQNGYQQFQPLLYQVATAELPDKDIAFDHTETFRGQSNVTVVKADVIAADPDRRSVTLADNSEISGDFLVLAAGAQPNFFHTKGANEFAFPLYSLTDAGRVRERAGQRRPTVRGLGRPEHSRRPRRHRPGAVPLSGQGHHGHDRPEGGRGRARTAPARAARPARVRRRARRPRRTPRQRRGRSQRIREVGRRLLRAAAPPLGRTTGSESSRPPEIHWGQSASTGPAPT